MSCKRLTYLTVTALVTSLCYLLWLCQNPKCSVELSPTQDTLVPSLSVDSTLLENINHTLIVADDAIHRRAVQQRIDRYSLDSLQRTVQEEEEVVKELHRVVTQKDSTMVIIRRGKKHLKRLLSATYQKQDSALARHRAIREELEQRNQTLSMTVEELRDSLHYVDSLIQTDKKLKRSFDKRQGEFKK